MMSKVFLWLSILVTTSVNTKAGNNGYQASVSAASAAFVVQQPTARTSRQPYQKPSLHKPFTSAALLFAPKTTRTKTTSLGMAGNAAKLWERLELEEDDERHWYLINCVATIEMDLLRQCRQVCEDLQPEDWDPATCGGLGLAGPQPDSSDELAKKAAADPDVCQFIVPTEQKTRSHGATKIVTETKTKYLGYVFAKIRLRQPVYEAIQALDLCRSWMGQPNQKGYRKMPPLPIALNDDEIEKFGLEEWLEQYGEMENSEIDGEAGNDDFTDAEGIIVDEADDSVGDSGNYDDDDDDDIVLAVPKGPKLTKAQQKAMKVYKGLRVDDMIKVTDENSQFYTEDGIVRRLKENRIMVRFYTYGTLFEEWLDPAQVRPLSNEEILKGLSGPKGPVTQRDFDGDEDERRGGDRNARRSLGNQLFRGQRNRKQDRTAGRFSSRNNNRDDRRQRDYQTNDSKDSWKDYNSATSDNWALGDVDSQWGRGGNNKRQSSPEKNSSKKLEAALDGNDNDWSAFVSSPGSSSSGDAASGGNTQSASSAPRKAPTDSSSDAGEDDFFATLMADLSKDLGPSPPPQTSSDNAYSDQRSNEPAAADSSLSSDEDDFFASLMTELENSEDTESSNEEWGARVSSPSSSQQPRRRSSRDVAAETPTTPTSADDDFFAALEAELGDELNSVGGGGAAASSMDEDDFFSSLEAELSDAVNNNNDNSIASLDEELSAVATTPSPPPATTSTPTSVNPSDLSKCTVPILKGMLKERGLKVSGKKAELIERLCSN